MPVTPTRQHLGRPQTSLECVFYSGSVVFLPHLEQWCALDGGGQGSQPKGRGGQDCRVCPPEKSAWSVVSFAVLWPRGAYEGWHGLSSYHVSEVTDRLRTSEKKAVFVNYPHQRNAIA